MANGKPGRPANKKVKEVKDEVIKEVVEEVIKTPKKVIKKQRDLNEIIEVKCIVHGGLYYVTSLGFEVVWANYGDINYLEYKELIHMAGKYKRFFEEPWVIAEQDVLEDLRVAKHYKKVIDYEDIDSIFTKNPEEVKETLDKLPEGTKRLIADRATYALRNGALDSLKVIEVLQKELSIDLI